MTRIKEEILVNCPPQRARDYLVGYLEELQRSEGGPATLRLTATMGSKSGPHVTVERNATAIFSPLSSAGDLEFRVLVDWAPDSHEPLPRFAGTFRLQWDEEFGNSRLVIEGSYEPPLGAVGRAFDAVIGHRIAQNTIRSLLEELRAVIEARYREDVGSR
jgi:hypothetical protein